LKGIISGGGKKCMKKDFEFKCRTAYEYKNLSLQEYYKTRNINRRIVRLKQNVLSTGCTRNTVTKFKKKKIFVQ